MEDVRIIGIEKEHSDGRVHYHGVIYNASDEIKVGEVFARKADNLEDEFDWVDAMQLAIFLNK